MEKINKKDIHIINMRYLLLYFLIYAIIGWLLETLYAVTTLGHFVKRGFLYGPLCPIYGWGAVILITCLKKYKTKPIKLFIYSTIIFSVFEYVAGFALDALFCARWWDYTNDFMNLNGRISIFFSFAWGIIALIFMHIIHPFIEKITKKVINKIPIKLQTIVIHIAFIVLVADTILSSMKYLDLF